MQHLVKSLDGVLEDIPETGRLEYGYLIGIKAFLSDYHQPAQAMKELDAKPVSTFAMSQVEMLVMSQRAVRKTPRPDIKVSGIPAWRCTYKLSTKWEPQNDLPLLIKPNRRIVRSFSGPYRLSLLNITRQHFCQYFDRVLWERQPD